MKFALIDDHQMVREGFKALIEEESPNWSVVFEANSFKECESILKTSVPDCAVIDISLPDKSGFEVAEFIGKKFPQVKRIMLSMYEEKSYIDKALGLGVDAYLSKRDAANELIIAINAVTKGQRFFSPSINTSYFSKNVIGSTLSKLTPRESEIFKLLAQGLNAKQVSQKIAITPKTAHVHRANIMTKLNLTSQIQLTKLALAEHVICVEDLS